MNPIASFTSATARIEMGYYGRLIVARIKPNEDLIASLEGLCAAHAIGHAVVRGAVGSLTEARLARGYGASEQIMAVVGPGIEILSVYGEVLGASENGPRTALSGVVADPAGQLYAGRFCRGGNLAFVTIEVSLQEWIVEQTATQPV
jgi:predicted DNA-binding protein with PD1-like motif